MTCKLSGYPIYAKRYDIMKWSFDKPNNNGNKKKNKAGKPKIV